MSNYLLNEMFLLTWGPDVSLNKALVNDTDKTALQGSSHEP